MATEATIALTNRSLRTIRTVRNLDLPRLTHLTDCPQQELEFLTDTGVISSQQLSSILAQIPAQTPLRAPLLTASNGTTTTPVEHFNTEMTLKDPYAHVQTPAPLPPPAYASTPPVLSLASALYAYSPTDTGDLALQPNDRIQVSEHMNNDCKILFPIG